MPCYEVRLVSVEFKAQNVNILEDAARMMGEEFFHEKEKGWVLIGDTKIDLVRMLAKGEQIEINRLKRTYSQAAVKAAAKAKGWVLDSWKTKQRNLYTVASKY